MCLAVPDGLDVASTAYGKLCFHRALMEPRGLPSFNSVKITRQTSPNQAPIDKRRIKTIFNHFRDKPARYNLQYGNGSPGETGA